jgi:hypothetical protein
VPLLATPLSTTSSDLLYGILRSNASHAFVLPTPYLQEKLVQAHREELLRQAEQQRFLAHLPGDRESLAGYLTAQLGVLLVALGTHLQRLEQRSKLAI